MPTRAQEKQDKEKKWNFLAAPYLLFPNMSGEITVKGIRVNASANVNEDLMELFIMLDSLKRSFAGRIHVVMPHFA